ncbi:MAG: hypothetical protein NTV23_02015 [Propionibacteriales bacterium]|nr:hypothetical protein [Propionibacteriales bacterium]
MSTRLLLGMLGLLGALLAAILPAAPASAAGELGLSADGTSWSDTLPAPLFDPDFRWVPGDVEVASFFVRNQDPQAGLLQVVMADTAVRSLMDTGDLEVAARVGAGEYVAVTSAGAQNLVQDEQIPAGGVRRVDVRVSFDPLSPNTSQAQQFDLRFDLTLSQDTSVLPPVDNGGGDGDGDGGVAGPVDGNGNGNGNGNLPGTGSAISRGLLLLAVILCAGGLGLVGLGRRDRDSKERHLHA